MPASFEGPFQDVRVVACLAGLPGLRHLSMQSLAGISSGGLYAFCVLGLQSCSSSLLISAVFGCFGRTARVRIGPMRQVVLHQVVRLSWHCVSLHPVLLGASPMGCIRGRLHLPEESESESLSLPLSLRHFL